MLDFLPFNVGRYILKIKNHYRFWLISYRCLLLDRFIFLSVLKSTALMELEITIYLFWLSLLFKGLFYICK